MALSSNKIGYLMSPDMAAYEEVMKTRTFRPMAMSIMASGAVPPREAIEYVAGQKHILQLIAGQVFDGGLPAVGPLPEARGGRIFEDCLVFGLFVVCVKKSGREAYGCCL